MYYKYRILIPSTDYVLKYVGSSGEALLYVQSGYKVEASCILCNVWYTYGERHNCDAQVQRW